MPRYRKPPLTLAEVLQPGPPVRLRDLIAVTTLSSMTIRTDIHCGILTAYQRVQRKNAPYFIDREEALRYLAQMGFVQRGAA